MSKRTQSRIFRLAITLGSLLFVACERNKVKEISGLWVSVDYRSDKPFNSLFISDSLVETNKYGVEKYPSPLWPEKDYFEAYDPHWSIAFRLYKKGDTLVQVFSSQERTKYVRADSAQLYRELFFCDSPVQITLPDADHQSEWLTVNRKTLTTHLYLGRLKSGSLVDFPEVSADSMAIQVGDVLIDRSGIEIFLKAEQSKLLETDRQSLIVILYADKETPCEAIHRITEIVREYEPELVVCRAYMDWDLGKIFYKRIP